MGITMIATGAFREAGASFFFIPKGHTYSPPPKCDAFWRRWYPSQWSGRALCEADAGRLRFLRKAPDDTCFVPLVRAAVGTVLDSASRDFRDAAAHYAARHLLLQNLPAAGFANLQADVLHPVVAGHLTGHSAKRIFEMIMATEVCGHYRKRRR